MAGKTQMRIEVADESELGAYCELQNAVWPDHPISLDEVLRDRQILPPEQQQTVWLCWRKGLPTGYATAYRYVGEYHPQKWNIMVGVLEASRRSGCGTALFDQTNQFIEGQNPISIATRVSDQDPDSLHFVASRGYLEHKRDFESELVLDEFDPDDHDPVIDEPVSIAPATDHDSPAQRREFHELFEELRVDVPRAEPPIRLEFERFQELVLDDPLFSWEMTRIAAANGQMIGFSGIFKTAQEGLLDQWLTAVHPKWRGKKLALALKVAVTRRAKELGYKRIRTNNDTRNGPMLAVNNRMGYRRLPGMITLIKRYGA